MWGSAERRAYVGRRLVGHCIRDRTKQPFDVERFNDRRFRGVRRAAPCLYWRCRSGNRNLY